MTPELAEKVKRLAGEFVIHKPLARWNDQYRNFPRFVMEYLVTQYVDPNDPITGQKRIEKLLTEHYSDSSERELIRSRVKESGITRRSHRSIRFICTQKSQEGGIGWMPVRGLTRNRVRH